MKKYSLLAVLAVALLVTARAARAAVIMPDSYVLYLSAPGAGTVGGVAYADEDVLRYSPTANPQWVMHFDGSVAGLPAAADIDAYDYAFNAATFTSWHYMSFDRPVAVPGLGTIDDSDVVLYHASLLGNTWTLFFDGSAYGLTTDGEDVDGLDVSDGALWLSTTAGFNVPLSGSANVLKGADQDYLLWSSDTNGFLARYLGTDMGIPADNDLINLAYATQDDDRHISIVSYFLFGVQKAANVSVVNAGAYDVLLRQFSPVNLNGEYAQLWDASASGFPKVDALAAVFHFD